MRVGKQIKAAIIWTWTEMCELKCSDITQQKHKYSSTQQSNKLLQETRVHSSKSNIGYNHHELLFIPDHIRLQQ